MAQTLTGDPRPVAAADCISAGILVADHLTTPIPRLPNAGELILCGEMPLSIGGCAANVAVDLTRLGLRVEVAGCVGKDALGRFIVETLVEAGAGVSLLTESADFGTSGSLIINVEGQDRRFITTIGANASLVPEQIDLAAVRRAKVLYLGGYLFTPALENERMVEVFRGARSYGVKTVLDVVVAGQSKGSADLWLRIERLLAETDVFLPNDHEAGLITGLSDPVKQAERFLEAGAKTVVITRGGEGVLLMNDKARLRTGVYPVDYIGGTGSGDAFDAGYIMGLILGGDERDCLRWGSAIGASCVRSVSATESVFARREAEEFMRRHELAIEPF
jgi:sugar/nucleoside kinase (ribokinase family)